MNMRYPPGGLVADLDGGSSGPGKFRRRLHGLWSRERAAQPCLGGGPQDMTAEDGDLQ